MRNLFSRLFPTGRTDRPSALDDRPTLDLAELEGRILFSAGPVDAGAAQPPEGEAPADAAGQDIAIEPTDLLIPLSKDRQSEVAIDDAPFVSLALEEAGPLLTLADDLFGEVTLGGKNIQLDDHAQLHLAGPADDVQQMLSLAELEPSIEAQSVAGEPPAEESASEVELIAPSDAAGEQTGATQEVVFVDTSAEDYEQLVDDLLGQREDGRIIDVVLLDSERDGIQQISEVLASYDDLDAIHIVSHGTDGAVKLGDSWLTLDNVSGYSGQLVGWRDALAVGADLLFYGCDLAGSEEGKTLVDSLAALCDCDVAASTDDTGHSIFGADWELEYTRGDIETLVAFSLDVQQNWGHLLNVAVDATSTGTSGGGDFTVSHTTSGTDGLMLVAVSMNLNSSETVNGITYNSDPLSFVGVAAIGDARLEIWSRIAPDLGMHDVDIDINGGSDGNTVGIMTFTGVDQTTPLGVFASGTGNSSSASAIVSSAINEFVFAAISVDDNADYNLVPGGSQTERWDLKAPEVNGGGSTEAGAASVNMSWTWTGPDNWAVGGVSIKAANVAPVLSDTVVTLDAVAEDAGAPSGAVGTLVSALADLNPPAGGQDNVTDADSSPSTGVAITGADTASGTWHYTTDGGTNWFALGGVADGSARVLAADGLTRVYFEPNADYEGTIASALTFRAWDQTDGNSNGTAAVDTSTNGGTTAYSGATDTASLTVTAVNDAPVLANTGVNLSPMIEDAGPPAGAVGTLVNALADLNPPAGGQDNVTDVDSGAATGVAITAADTANGTWHYSTDGGGSWFALGAVSNSSARVLAADGLTRVYFEPNANYQGTMFAALTFRAWDQTDGNANGTAGVDTSTNGNATAYSTATDVAGLTVININDAPSLDNTGAMTLTNIAEDDFTSAGDTVSAIVASAGGDRITDIDPSPTEGVAVIGVDDTNGQWQYDAGGGWTAFGAVTNTSAVVLDATASIRFVPNADYSGTAGDITLRAWDRTDGNPPGTTGVDVSTNGGTTAYSTATETATLTVSAANDAPVLADTVVALSAVAEDAGSPSGAVGTLVSSIADLVGGGGQDNVTDIDSGAVTGLAITAADTANGTWHYTTDGGTNWFALGAVADGSARVLAADGLTRVYFEPSADYNGTIPAALTFRAWDQTDGNGNGTAAVDTSTNGGATAYSTATDTASLTVTAVNDAPVLADTVVALSAVAEDAGAPSGAVGTLVSSIADLVGGGGQDNVTDIDGGAVTGLAITAADTANGTWHYTTDGGTNWFSLGAVADGSARVLAADGLTRVYFEPNADYEGAIPAALTFRAWDQTDGNANGTAAVDTSTNGGVTAYSSATDTASLTVTPINDAPVLADTVVALSAVAEDAGSPSGAVGTLVSSIADLVGGGGQDNVTDIDSGAVTGLAITAADTTNGTWHYTTDGGTNWFSLGAVADGSARVLAADGLTRVYFEPNADYNGAIPTALTFRAWDQTDGNANGTAAVDTSTNGGTTAYSTATDTASLTVTVGNDAPVLADTVVTLTAVAEDAGSPAGAVGTLVSSIADLVGGGGQDNVTDIDSGAVTGLAITGADTANGTWHYTTDGGTNWFALGAVADGSARVLAADGLTRVYFEPNADYNGAIPAALTFRAWDQTDGNANGTAAVDTSTNGGVTAYSSATDTASLTVTNVNDAPLLDNTGSMNLTNVVEDDFNPPGTSVASIIASAGGDRITDVDPAPVEGIAVTGVDDTNGQWQYDAGGGWTAFGAVAGNSAVVLDTTALIRFVPDPSYNGPAGDITLRAWDQTDGNASGTTGVDVSTNGGTTAYSTATETATLTILPTNDAPVLADTVVTLSAVAEDAGSPSGAVGTLVSSIADLVGGGGQDNVTDIDGGAVTGLAITAADTTNGTWHYTIDGGTNWFSLGAVADGSARVLAADGLTRVYFEPNADYNGTIPTALTFRAWDQTDGNANGTAAVDTSTNGGTTAYSMATDTASLTVTVGNDAPVLADTVVTLTSVAEDAGSPSGAVGTLVSSIADLVGGGGQDNVTDIDSGPVTGLAITGADATNGTWHYTTDGGTNWFALGAVADGSARVLAADGLTRVYFEPSADYAGTIPAALTFRAWDQTDGNANGTAAVDTSTNGGVTAYSTATDTASLTVTNVNDAPLLDNTGSMNLTNVVEDDFNPPGTSVASIIASGGGDRITDVDPAPVEGIAVIGVDDTDGQWQYDAGGGWTAFGAVAGNSAVVLDPTALVRFVPNASYNGPAGDITLRAWDQTDGNASGTTGVDVSTNGGTTAYSTATETATLTILPINDAPVLADTVVTLSATAEDAGPPTGGVGTLVSSIADLVGGGGQDNVTDIDAGAVTGLAITGADTTNGTWHYTTDGGTNWFALGAVADGSARVLAADGLTRVYFEPNADYNGTIPTALTFRAWDQTDGNANGTAAVDTSTNGGTTAYSTATDTASLTVTAGNDAPVLADTVVTLNPVAEEAGAPAGAVGTLVSSIADLVGGGGQDNVTDIDSGPVTGLAITGADATNGTWHYTTDGGTNWFALGAVADGSARVLAADGLTRVYFEPSADYNGAIPTALTFRAWDQTDGNANGTAAVDTSTNGGVTAYSSATDTASLTVTNVNDAPLLDNTGSMNLTNVVEDDFNPPGTSVASIIASAGGDRITDVDPAPVEGIAVIAVDDTDGQWQYDAGGGWTAFGAVAGNSAVVLDTTALIRFVPDPSYNGPAGDITLRAWDQTDGNASGTTGVDVSTNGGTTAYSTATETATLTILPTNDAPVLADTVVTLGATAEDAGPPTGAVGTLVSSIADLVGGGGQDNVTDIDGGAVTGLAITGADATSGTWHYTTDGGTNWFSLGAVADGSARVLAADGLTRVFFQPNADYNGTIPTALTFRAWDQTDGNANGTAAVDTSTNGGTTAYSTATDTASLTVTAGNDAPVLADTVVTLNPVAEEAGPPSGAVGTLVPSIVDLLGGGGQDNVTDIDSGAITGLAITGADTANGTWHYTTDGGTNWFALGAVADGSARVLAADGLTRVYFEPNADFEGTLPSALTFRAWDQLDGNANGTAGVDTSTNGGVTAYSTATDTASLTVTGSNDAPLLDNTGNMLLTNVAEDDFNPPGNSVASIVASAGGDRITDVDTGAVEGIAVIAVDDTNGQWQYDAGGGWTAFGAVAGNSAVVLDATALIRFVPNASYTGPAGDITLRAWDQTDANPSGTTGVDVSTNGGGTAYSAATETATLTITPTNSAPVLDNTGAMALTDIAEDTFNPAGDDVASIVASAGGDRITDVDAGAVEGIAVIAADDTNGQWQYDAGGGWTAFGAVAGNSAVLLDATALVRFVPTADYNGPAGDITFRAWDRTDANPPGTTGVDVSTNGGGTSFSAATETATLNVTAVNDAPTAVNDVAATNEDVPLVISAASLLANDSDVDPDTLSITGFTQPPDGTLVDNGDGTFTYTPDADFNGSDVFTYTVDDGNGGSDTATVTITVAAVNDSPASGGDSYTVAQNDILTIAAPGVLANDTDVEGSPLSAVQVTGPASGTLSLNPDGSFTYQPFVTFSGTDSFTYVADDGTATGSPTTVTISVQPIGIESQPPDDPPEPPPAEEPPDIEPESEPSDGEEPPAESGESGRTNDKTGGLARQRTAAQRLARPVDNGSLPIGVDAIQDEDMLFVGIGRRRIAEVSSIDRAAVTLSSTTHVDLEVLSQQFASFQEDVTYQKYSVELTAGTIATSVAALSAGYVIWTLRAGYLATSLLTSLPTWIAFDPLPILNHSPAGKDDEECTETLTSLLSRGAGNG